MNNQTVKPYSPLFIWLLVYLLLFFPLLAAQDVDKLLKEGFLEGITVDLREPSYSNGILSTTQGGVISADRLRIQAQQLRYSHQVIDNQKILTVEAEGDLMIEFGDYVFIGENLFYDFQKKEGVIYQGRTSVEPWHFGGERLELRSDGSYVIYNGYVTTSEKDIPDWGVYSKEVNVEEERLVHAQQVQLRLFHRTILWIPSLRTNLESIFDSPIRYRFRWGGRQGPRFGLTYEIFSWKNWKTFIRFDYRLTRGPGGGIEMHYRAPDDKTVFRSINYLAKDSSLLHLHEKARYRFEGHFQKLMDQDRTSILFTYDKISDKDMPSSYYERDFVFDISERTQLLMRRQEEQWIGNFYTRVRVNSFQTVKQELPTLDVHFKPFDFGKTGLIIHNWANASYLDFKYSKYLLHVHDYASTRFEYRPTLYRPFVLGRFLTFTPEVGAVTILYGNSPEREEQWLGLVKAGADLKTELYRYYGPCKHVIEPYTFYRYYSAPTSSPHQHFIFDMEDGWTHLNYLSFGVKNAFYKKKTDGCIRRVFFTNFYTYVFFNAQKIGQAIPRVYGKMVLFSLPTIKHTVDAAWNLQHNQVDHFNLRSEWTLDADFALSAEYRHRGPYSWRKVDPENFFLDVFHSENRLLHSSLSDQRDTLLLHFFYRFHPNWALEFASQQGWNRRREPSYLEYEIDLLTTIQTAWHLRFSFQHKENDNRFAMYVTVGLKRPDTKPCERTLYCYE